MESFKAYERDVIDNVKLAVDKFFMDEDSIKKYKTLKKGFVYDKLKFKLIELPTNLKQSNVILKIVELFGDAEDSADKVKFMFDELSHIMTTGDSSIPLDISKEGFVTLRRYLKGIKNHIESDKLINK